MATYKVIQDIEADDKLLGPLSLKQFIYFSITAVCLYLTFLAATKGAPWVGIPLFPPAFFFGLLAFPWSKAQPTEIWLLAKIRFFFKPRKRIWDQADIKELVTITVPKKVERHLTDGLDQNQVRNRLTALAQTVDSRGWAVKQLASAPFGQVASSQPTSDRLTVGTEINQSTVTTDVTNVDDVLDERNNPTAQKIDKMITDSTATHRDAIRSQLAHAQPVQQSTSQSTPAGQPVDYWFMSQNDPAKTPAGMTTPEANVVMPRSEVTQPAQPAPQPTQVSKEDEEALLEKIHTTKSQKKTFNSRQKTIVPLSDQKKQDEEQKEKAMSADQRAQPKPDNPSSKPTPDPAILGLANNDDLNVETIARQANKRKEEPPDEVVISLH